MKYDIKKALSNFKNRCLNKTEVRKQLKSIMVNTEGDMICSDGRKLFRHFINVEDLRTGINGRESEHVIYFEELEKLKKLKRIDRIEFYDEFARFVNCTDFVDIQPEKDIKFPNWRQVYTAYYDFVIENIDWKKIYNRIKNMDMENIKLKFYHDYIEFYNDDIQPVEELEAWRKENFDKMNLEENTKDMERIGELNNLFKRIYEIIYEDRSLLFDVQRITELKENKNDFLFDIKIQGEQKEGIPEDHAGLEKVYNFKYFLDMLKCFDKNIYNLDIHLTNHISNPVKFKQVGGDFESLLMPMRKKEKRVYC